MGQNAYSRGILIKRLPLYNTSMKGVTVIGVCAIWEICYREWDELSGVSSGRCVAWWHI